MYLWWYRLRDGEELVLDDERYEGGVTEQTSLTVKNSSSIDMGVYICILSNSVGKSTSDDEINVSILCNYWIFNC